jgi:thiol-disulfide isomerase/thioredoxin
MNPLAIAATLLGLVAAASALGLVWRSRTGRIHEVTGGDTRIRVDQLSPDAVAGTAATLLQFSTEVCTPCRTTRSLLSSLAAELPGVAHVDVDVSTRADLADRFNLLQSPTTFILDGRGIVRARIGGAPRLGDLRAELDRILADAVAGRPRTTPAGRNTTTTTGSERS